MPSSAMQSPTMPSPGGKAMHRRDFQEYGERPGSQQQEPPSKPIPSVNLSQAKIIIKEYVERFNNGNLIVNATDLARILAANNTIDKEETDQEKKLAVKYLYEFAENFNQKKYDINGWFIHSLKVLSTY